MTAVERIDVIVQESLGALARLEPGELEALEERLLKLVGEDAAAHLQNEISPQYKLKLTRGMELLGRCVAMTASNLQVLERLTPARMEPALLLHRKEGV